jgi:hypothetical protein
MSAARQLTEPVTVAEWREHRGDESIGQLVPNARRNLIEMRTWHCIEGKLLSITTDIRHLSRFAKVISGAARILLQLIERAGPDLFDEPANIRATPFLVRLERYSNQAVLWESRVCARRSRTACSRAEKRHLWPASRNGAQLPTRNCSFVWCPKRAGDPSWHHAAERNRNEKR